MRRLITICLIAVIVLSLTTACTEQQRARNFGGTTYIDLPKGQKLMVATWKNDDLFYLHRNMREGEKPENYTFQESSSFGMMQGKVIFRESQ